MSFWRDKTLEQMTSAEWESLCDGCGLCCLIKMEDVDSGAVLYTNLACRLLDCETCRCGDYANRKSLVSDCVQLSPETLPEAAVWLPETCAYKRLHEGGDLPAWHPLRTGDPQSVHEAGVSVQGWAIPEYEVPEEDWIDHLLEGA